MRTVVADTAPLNYLVWIGEADVLPRLYERILIPDVVLAELQDSGAPAAVVAWGAQLPLWIDVRPAPVSHDESLTGLDAGERAAILLAEAQEPPVLLIIDDAYGRTIAGRRSIAVTGTLGVLRAAALRGWLQLPAAFARLRETNFHAPVALMDELLAEDAEREHK